MLNIKKIIFMNIKKSIVFMTALILIGLITIGNTYAYLNSPLKKLTNNLDIGMITTEILEEHDNNGKKICTIKNTDDIDCLVRMKVYKSPKCAPLDIIGYSTSNNWSECDNEEYYYYNKVLKHEEITDSLFTGYSIKQGEIEKFEKEYGNKFQIILYQEAVQAEIVFEGQTIKAEDNGIFNAENAEKIWTFYDSNGTSIE